MAPAREIRTQTLRNCREFSEAGGDTGGRPEAGGGSGGRPKKREVAPVANREGLQQSAAAGRNDSQAEEGVHEKTLGKSKTQRLAASANTAEATVFVKTLGTGQATLSNSTCLK